jgi:2-polyprenyl-6-hydroxyphenyl methylase/3-demethylubiquinone-9 3-methyltransferase
MGARVTAIDMAEAPLAVARLHLKKSGMEIDYLRETAESHAAANAGAYDIVTCLEMLEHVPDPSAIVAACARLVKPGGAVFFSTINRNPKAFLMAIVGAEYVLGLLPKGTHEYAKLIRPAELAEWARQAGLDVRETTGMHYNPFTRDCRLGGNVHVNYVMYARRPAEDGP